MARAATLAVFLLCFCFFRTSTGSQDGCDLNAATNTTVTVPLTYTLKESDNLRWFKDTTLIFNSKNKKNAEDVDSSGSLKLTQLTKDKSGTYRGVVYNGDGKNVGNSPLTKLCVLDRVQKPKVTVKCEDSKVTFTCSVGQNEKIEWLMDGKNLTGQGQKLKKEASEVGNSRIVCKVSNPVSSEASQPADQTCYQPWFPEELWGISIWVFVGGGAGIVLVLILIVIICCIQTKRKRRMRLKDEGELRLQWTNQERQQQHHQHQHQHQNHPDHHQHPHHHQQQPAGNTGPRQPRSKQQRAQQRAQQRPRAPDPPNGHPQPSPRRAAQASKPADNSNEEQPPPLPQPRKKTAPKE